tara:strand:- start:61 stop:636 length:576 start_codon:yes stop_codon:yes gene_type:complete
MKKLSTLFKKDPKDLGRVINEINPENEWALKFGRPTRKFDGTSCAIINGELYKRYDAKKNKKGIKKPIPKGAIPCQEPDEKSGHHPHWIKCDEKDKSNKYHFEAFEDLIKLNSTPLDGTYELCGEKVQANPENIKGHKLIMHGKNILPLINFDFERIKHFLTVTDIEGIVFHHLTDGRMCKIRKSDFGIRR